MNSRLTRLNKSYGLRIGVLLAMIAVFMLLSPGFRRVSTVYSLFEQLPFVGLVALGVAVTMIAGELDLSVASLAALSGVVAIHASRWGLVPAIVAGLACGLVLGAVQGLIIARLGLNSLVLTVGTLVLFRGLAYVLSGGRPIVLEDFAVSDPLQARWGIVSPGSLLAIGVFATVLFLLALTRPGRSIYAIGGARAEARAAGVPVVAPLVQSFLISGGLAGLAGALACLKGGSAAPESFHELLLMAAGAAMIGGIALTGGVGTVWHVLLGVGITGTLTVGMATLAGPAYVSSLVLGLLLVAILVVDAVTGRIRGRAVLVRLRQNVVRSSKSLGEES